ncbi:hypothetical protein [Prosthecobacter sp.]|uniref:hypothetical protein n=1 Tax=Prosthecobacter sp. TaxID=1965333 RepID=UPI002AB7F8E8|nr:hypothetical protein [Prosthecobacter sp.]MDZ4403631.1 hypothetical protein [Prosthecobacter sp.]
MKRTTLGRPKLPEDETKQVFTLRLSANEKEAIATAANKAKQKPREWARAVLLANSAVA